MTRTWALAFAVATIGTASAGVEPTSTGELKEACAAIPAASLISAAGYSVDAELRSKAERCSAYVVGFVDGATVQAGVIGTPEASRILCVPPGVDGRQIAAVFVRYAEAHPEMWHQPAPRALAPALVAAFPCQRH